MILFRSAMGIVAGTGFAGVLLAIRFLALPVVDPVPVAAARQRVREVATALEFETGDPERVAARDLFSPDRKITPYDVPEPSAAVTFRTPDEPGSPALILTGIAFGNTPVAAFEILGAESSAHLVSVGDSIAGARVAMVLPDRVTLASSDSVWTLFVRDP